MNNSPPTVNVLIDLAVFLGDNPDVQFTRLDASTGYIEFGAETVAEFNATKEAIWAWLDASPNWVDDDEDFHIAGWSYGDWRVRLYGFKDMPMTGER